MLQTDYERTLAKKNELIKIANDLENILTLIEN